MESVTIPVWADAITPHMGVPEVSRTASYRPAILFMLPRDRSGVACSQAARCIAFSLQTASGRFPPCRPQTHFSLDNPNPLTPAGPLPPPCRRAVRHATGVVEGHMARGSEAALAPLRVCRCADPRGGAGAQGPAAGRPGGDLFTPPIRARPRARPSRDMEGPFMIMVRQQRRITVLSLR